MRAFVSLIGGAVLLAILVIVLVLRMAPPRARPEVAAPPDPEPETPRHRRALTPPAPAPAPARVLPAEPRRTRVAEVAIIRGGVIDAAAGDDGELQDLEVVADDGSGTFAARVSGRRFEVRLPPRVYSITARAGDLVGRVEAVDALAGVAREVLVRLEPGAAIEGTVRGVDGDKLARGSVRALRAGTRHEEATAELDESGAFTLGGLFAGGRYDLEAEVPGARDARLEGITAPARDLTVPVERTPVLRGALGTPPGEICSGEKVTIRAPDGVETLLDLEADCSFEAPVSAGTRVLVRISGEGRHHEAEVAVPSTGDPEPLCLDPPCVPAVPATLEARIEGEGCERGHVSISGDDRGVLCSLRDGRCQLNGLKPGARMTVSGRCAGCEGEPRELVLAPGPNAIALPCRRVRAIEGVVRRTGGDRAPVPMTVRCAGGVERVRDSFTFRLRCAGQVGEIEYRLDAEPGRWHKLPVAGTGNPVLVDLPLP